MGRVVKNDNDRDEYNEGVEKKRGGGGGVRGVREGEKEMMCEPRKRIL